MQSVFLLLGSNLGDRLSFLKKATERIATSIAPTLRKSQVYETEAWGNPEAPDYLNQVLLLAVDLSAVKLLEKVLQIEEELGRRRDEKWGSRTIDIDILFYGDELIDQPDLQIPHPELHKRKFTLEPLAEIAPYFVHPGFKKNILTLKAELFDNLHVKRYIFEKDPKMQMLENSMPQDLDLAPLFEIADGSNEFLVEFIEMFLHQTPELLTAIGNGLEAQDWPVVAAAAHKLKPNLGTFGMPISQALMQEIELMAKSGSPVVEVINAKYTDVKAIVSDNLVSLTRIKEEKEAEL